MRLRSAIIASLAAIAGGSGVAAMVSAAGAATGPVTVTLGSTTGTPSQNKCVDACTYVPFSNAGVPALQVTGDGTVTSFSINSGSTGNQVRLRVLAPAANGQFTGAGTSPAETLGGGVSTFAVSLPVKGGDVLALDNADSAIVFATVGGTALTAYYETPPLADGATAAPNNVQGGYQLLMSATVALSPTTSTSTATPTQTVTTTQTVTVPVVAPVLSRFTQSHRTWRAGGKPAVAAKRSRPPVGTVFSYQLSQAATTSFGFVQELAGRVVRRRCVAVAPANAHHRACTRRGVRRTLTENAHSGGNRLSFQGRLPKPPRLPTGSYAVSLQARNSAGLTSAVRSLTFTIAK